MSVRAIIGKYEEEYFAMDSADPTKRMVEELQAHRRSLRISFWVLFAVITAGTGLAAYLVATITSPAMLKAVSIGMGLSVAGGLEYLRRVWTEWSRADLLVVMLMGASKKVAAEIVRQLASGYALAK